MNVKLEKQINNNGGKTVSNLPISVCNVHCRRFNRKRSGGVRGGDNVGGGGQCNNE